MSIEIYMSNKIVKKYPTNIQAFIVPEILTFIRTDGYGRTDSAIDPEQEYIHFIWSETIHSACSIPFYSKSNGYKNRGP